MRLNKCISLTLLTFSINAFCQPEDYSLFRNTPMRSTMDTLLNDMPQQAWQELLLAISQNNIKPQIWLPVKEAILSKSNCGHLFNQNLNSGYTQLTLSIISRINHSSSGYQIKLSAEQVGNNNNFILFDSSGEIVLKGKWNKNLTYQEWETKDLVSQPKNGVYKLVSNNSEIPIILSNYNTKDWLIPEQLNSNKLKVNFPKLNNNCAVPSIFLQWFDANYNQLGKNIVIKKQGKEISIKKEFTPPLGAYNLRATTMTYEYQPGIKVQYIHRVAIPFTNLDR